MTRTDAELLLAARQDPTAFREFYDRYVTDDDGPGAAPLIRPWESDLFR